VVRSGPALIVNVDTFCMVAISLGQLSINSLK
jgi:hypothetical protein